MPAPETSNTRSALDHTPKDALPLQAHGKSFGGFELTAQGHRWTSPVVAIWCSERWNHTRSPNPTAGARWSAYGALRHDVIILLLLQVWTDGRRCRGKKDYKCLLPRTSCVPRTVPYILVCPSYPNTPLARPTIQLLRSRWRLTSSYHRCRRQRTCLLTSMPATGCVLRHGRCLDYQLRW